MHVKYRARFFRLVDLFLSSTHLPDQLVASFIRRMSRLSLTSPPHGIVNLIRRHPSCMVLIHRPSDSISSTSDESDPYDFDEPDPIKSNAIDSSLWEMKLFETETKRNKSKKESEEACSGFRKAQTRLSSG
ncbi:hypothetical protein Glove_346g76 [Diversispora epigaea]|uniref:CCAAT-binding factor domain-containing protein n=1 Tax=Diversispora epigaea TaxID=1348612 RepID=A0A397HHY1_9GLOM|nr:hypothetical protein Glove_346g76 [Diversispora epigaea]